MEIRHKKNKMHSIFRKESEKERATNKNKIQEYRKNFRKMLTMNTNSSNTNIDNKVYVIVVDLMDHPYCVLKRFHHHFPVMNLEVDNWNVATPICYKTFYVPITNVIVALERLNRQLHIKQIKCIAFAI